MIRTILAALSALAILEQALQPLVYPPAPKGNVVDDHFGTKVADPYRWMEDLNSPEVKQFIEQKLPAFIPAGFSS